MSKKYLKNLISRCLICIILFLTISIICIFSNKNLLWFKNNIYNNKINFSYFNKIYDKYINKYLPFDLYKEQVVMKEGLIYKEKEKFLNGVSLNVGNNYNMYTLNGGIVVYIGEKEKLGNTVIIQGTDGIDYWYSNIENLSVNLYDYVEKNILLGTSINDYIYLTFMSDGKYLDYEKYI